MERVSLGGHMMTVDIVTNEQGGPREVFTEQIPDILFNEGVSEFDDLINTLFFHFSRDEL
ncbi:hypothetical protein BRC83_08775 [Halobacteriales archaeon QS_1_68_17]|nr:MAG: hypothetical protein BRC83_08775 [Halobacteriales archaeon QS_1_68_17]